MKKIKFTKLVASGNDFVLTDAPNVGKLARRICDRKFGVGADGLLVLEKSKKANVRMRIFNADGSEAEMCGNGARCVALWAKSKVKSQKSKLIKIETKAGIIAAIVKGNNVKIRLTDPKNIKLDFPIKLNNRALRVNFINTGVPHTAVFVEGLEKIDVAGIGRQIRNHQAFKPAGTNVDFIEVTSRDSIAVRTYERGVEDETLACGTGSAASALLTAYSLKLKADKINVKTQSGEILKVYFKKEKNKFSDVWLEGKAKMVYTGVYNV